MIVIGAKGLAKEVLEILVSEKYCYSHNRLFFFDDVKANTELDLFGYKIIKTKEEVKHKFTHVESKFCLGLGNPLLRYKLSIDFEGLGGKLEKIVSSDAKIGSFGTYIGEGTTIIGNSIITNNIKIGKGCLIYMNTSITHDVVIGDFVEISPGVSIAGRVIIGDFTAIGIGASIIQDVTIGKNCIIGAGSVVINDIPDNSVVVGIPGRIIKERKLI